MTEHQFDVWSEAIQSSFVMGHFPPRWADATAATDDALSFFIYLTLHNIKPILICLYVTLEHLNNFIHTHIQIKMF